MHKNRPCFSGLYRLPTGAFVIIDSSDIEQDTLVTDVCVIGAGAAGITIALQLANARYDVLLLEGGGLGREKDTQMLYAGESVGIPYAPLDQCRSRFFGGSTNCWLGWCRPLDPIDFEPRPWMSAEGWPIRREELFDAYCEAQKLLMLGPFDYDRRSWARRIGREATLLQYDRTHVEDGVTQISPPARFGRLFRQALAAARNVRVLLHANVSELLVDSHGKTIERVHVLRPNGAPMVVFPKMAVLATGGIENARLLLASDRLHAQGLANAHDLVGRYFMDHPRVRSVAVRVPAKGIRRLYDHSYALVRQRVGIRRPPMTMHFAPTHRQQRELQLPNSRTYLVSSSFTAISALHARLRVLQHRGERPRGIRAWRNDLRHALQCFPPALTAAGDYLLPDRRQHGEFCLETVLEPIANTASRVILISERDRLGMRKVRLDWRLSHADRANYLHSIRLVVAELTAHGIIEPIDIAENVGRQWPSGVQWCWHHIGTTRMHRDPQKGVVDVNCRVHGINNLFVAGSSVFPTPGSDTPTLTIVALAVRLAGHLRHLLAAGQVADLPRVLAQTSRSP
jgi:choline dehydrogenase-like flavoprotein